MLQNNTGWSVAHNFAFSPHLKWVTYDKDILMLQDKVSGWSVAHYLAKESYKTKWHTDEQDITTAISMINIYNWKKTHNLIKNNEG